MTLETLQWFFNLLKTSAPVSLDCLAFLINYSNFIPGVESTFIAIINSNFFLKSRSMRSDTPYKCYSEPRMIPILYSYKKKNTRPYCDLRWSQLIFQSCLNWPIKKKNTKKLLQVTARYKNKITVYNAQPLHPMLSHLLQLLLIHLSWEVVNLFSPGRGYFSQSRASSSLYGPTQFLLKSGGLSFSTVISCT